MSAELTITVLITSAGRRVGLCDAFRRSAAHLDIPLRLLACDAEPALSAACVIADEHFRIGRCDEPCYTDRIRALIEAHHVDLVVPTIDPELRPLAELASCGALNGTRIAVSPPDVIDIVRDKIRTIRHLAAHGVPVPWTAPLELVAGCPDVAIGWPLFVKPRGGSASRGLKIAHTRRDLPRACCEPMLVQSLLEGPEYTVNIFIDGAGELRAAVPHRRIAVRAGEVEKGVTVRDPRLDTIARNVAAALPAARGVICFQAIDDKTEGLKVFEVNARFGGGYPLADHAGARFAQWLLEEVAGRPLSASNDWRAGVTMLRYDAAFFRTEP